MKKTIITSQKRVINKKKWFDRSKNSMKPTKNAEQKMNKLKNKDITEEEDEEKNGIL